MQIMFVESMYIDVVQGVPPTVTVQPEENSVPVTAIFEPPFTLMPELGEMEMTVVTAMGRGGEGKGGGAGRGGTGGVKGGAGGRRGGGLGGEG